MLAKLSPLRRGGGKPLVGVSATAKASALPAPPPASRLPRPAWALSASHGGEGARLQ
jgi:hypothetical protein